MNYSMPFAGASRPVASSPQENFCTGLDAGKRLLRQLNGQMSSKYDEPREDYRPMRIAIPLAGGKLSPHFGHCEGFALFDVDPTEKKILRREEIVAPPHEPGLLPRWLAERGASVVITGGMGQRAQQLFAQHGISVVLGAPADVPERVVGDYLAGTLQLGNNVCDH